MVSLEIKIQQYLFLVLCFTYLCLGLGKDITSINLLNSVATNEITNIFSIIAIIQSLHFSYLIVNQYMPYQWTWKTKIFFILLLSFIIRLIYALATSLGHFLIN